VVAVFSGLADGTHTIYVQAQDAHGYWGTAVTKTFVKDTTGPAVNSITLSPNPSVSTPSISASISDAGSNVAASEYWIDSHGAAGTGTPMTTPSGSSVTATVTAANFTSIFGGLSAGPHTIYVDAKDALGQWGSQTSTTFTKNLESPAVAPTTTFTAFYFGPSGGSPLSTPASGWFNNSTLYIGYTATDSGGSGVYHTYYSVDGGPTQLASGRIPISASGIHNVTIWSVDVSGNIESPKAVPTFKLDNVKPTATADLSPSGSYGSPITVTGTWTAGPSGVSNIAVSIYDFVTHYSYITIAMQNGSAVQNLPATVNPDGTWSFTFTPTSAVWGSSISTNVEGDYWTAVMNYSSVSGVAGDQGYSNGGGNVIYSSVPTVGFVGGGGTGATGTAILSNGTSGFVTGVNVTNGGSGYTSSPMVTFTGGGGFHAVGTAVIINGMVDRVDTTPIIITKATPTVTVTTADAIYDGNQHGATAVVTGVQGLNQVLTVSYQGINGTSYGPTTVAPTDAGQYEADASYAGSTDFFAAAGSANFTINQAGSTTTVTWAGGTSTTYDGNPHGATASWASTSTDGGGGPLMVTYLGINGTVYASTTTAPTNAGQYQASASYAGDANHTGSSGSANFTINPQTTVTATYTGDLFVATKDASTSYATVNLSATITVGSGVITTATVQFYNVATAANIGSPLPVSSAGTVSTTWTADIGSNNSQTFTIGILVGGNYSRNSTDDDAMVTVSKPVSGSATGGGFVVNGSHGTTPGGSVNPDPGERTTYGFEAKYSSKGNSGNVNIIVHHGSSDYQFKATSISTVTFPGSDSGGVRATISGTGNITDVTDPAHPVTLYTGATIQVSMHDAGEPGTSDTIGFTIRLGDAGKTLWYSNNLVSGQTVEALRDGGNLQVRAAQLAADLPSPNVAAPAPLTLGKLQPIVAAAEARWEAAGIDPRRLNAAMENVSIRLDNLTGTDLAWSSPGIITISTSAAGFGWFVDSTPHNDSEFAPGAVNSPARGHMDLLSVVAHEIGLHLGFGEDSGTAVMAQYLPAGVRHVPLPQTAPSAVATSVPMSLINQGLTAVAIPPAVLDGSIGNDHASRRAPSQAMPAATAKSIPMVAVRSNLVPTVGLDGSVLHDLALEQMTSMGLPFGRRAKK
jgi:hypothetical protein